MKMYLTGGRLSRLLGFWIRKLSSYQQLIYIENYIFMSVIFNNHFEI